MSAPTLENPQLDVVAKAQLRAPFAARRRRVRPGLRTATAAAIVYVAAMPLLRPSGPVNTAPVDVAGVVLVAAIGFAWVTGRVRLSLPYAVPVALFALAGTVGALAGPVPGLGMTAVVQDLVLLAVCGALATVASEPGIGRLLVRVWAVSALFWAVVLIVGVVGNISMLSGVNVREGARASLTMGDPNMAANYFAVSTFVLYASKWPTRRRWRIVATLLLVSAMLLTGSNGAVLATVFGALVGIAVAACFAQRRRLVWGLLAVVALAVLLAGAAPLSRWQQDVVTQAQGSSLRIVRDSVGRQDQSSSTRHTLLEESLQLLRSDTVVGSGPGSTKARLESNQYAYQKEAHDDYFAAVTERGALGVLALALLIGAVGRRLVARSHVESARFAVGRRSPPALSPAAATGCAVVLATSAMFYEVLHFRQLWVFLALLASDTIRGRR